MSEYLKYFLRSVFYFVLRNMPNMIKVFKMPFQNNYNYWTTNQLLNNNIFCVFATFLTSNCDLMVNINVLLTWHVSIYLTTQRFNCKVCLSSNVLFIFTMKLVTVVYVPSLLYVSRETMSACRYIVKQICQMFVLNTINGKNMDEFFGINSRYIVPCLHKHRINK